MGKIGHHFDRRGDLALQGDIPSRLTAVVTNRFACAREVVIILGIRPIIPVKE
jgi:hypothetical protein